MFSGIVEATAKVLRSTSNAAEPGLIRIDVGRPEIFDDLKVGDSICCSGICLTIENFTPEAMSFALGAETLRLTGWTAESLKTKILNVERSLRFGDRIHGHTVSGHVDATGEVVTVRDAGGSREIGVQVSAELRPFIWKKGSWAADGVSLTINQVSLNGVVEMCLIPETLKRTTLTHLRVGDRVNLEIDMVARGLVHYFQNHPDMAEGAARMVKGDVK